MPLPPRFRPRNSLLWRALMTNVAVLGGTVACLVFVFLMATRAGFQRQLELRAEEVAQFLARGSEFSILVGDTAELERMARNALSSEDLLYVAILDNGGNLLAQVSRPELAGARIPPRPPGAPPLGTIGDLRLGQGKPVVVDVLVQVARSGNNRVLEWEAARRSPSVLGAVRVGLSRRKEEQLFWRVVIGGSLIVIAAFCITVLIQYFQLRHLLRPLQHLVTYSKQVGQGDLSQQVPVETPDEVGELAMAFNQSVAISREAKSSCDQLQQALERERELSELKSRVVSTVSHEFRTPLSIILSSAELLQLHADRLRPERKLEHLQRIQSAGRHMNDLLSDVLLANKAEAGKLSLTLASADVVGYTREVVEQLEAAEKRNTPVRFSVAGTPRSAMLDMKLTRVMLQNILSNAFKYSPPDSEVEVTVAFAEDQFAIEVKDRGIGISKEDQAHLFEMFHRGNNARNHPGTGLGMSIVKKVVELHGGRIEVHSQENCGTTMSVSLPYASPAAASQCIVGSKL